MRPIPRPRDLLPGRQSCRSDKKCTCLEKRVLVTEASNLLSFDQLAEEGHTNRGALSKGSLMRVRTEPPTSKITQNRAAMLRQRMGEVKGKFGQILTDGNSDKLLGQTSALDSGHLPALP